MKEQNRSEKAIRNYIANLTSFSWASDVAEHSIWGFRGAPYKNFKKAIDKVKRVIDNMEKEGLIIKEYNDGRYTIVYNKPKPLFRTAN